MSNLTPNKASYELAIRDFKNARKQAAIQQTLARIKGESTDLLCFDMVRQQLRATGETVKHGLQEIPLDKIVGSVGRYEDFTRSFLPKKDSDETRWVGVKKAISDMVGMSPIDVYQVGEAYFVEDGKHSVSIARQLGTKMISAHVTEVKTRVPLTADDDPNEIICKAHYADFLIDTNLDNMRPGVDLLMTFCGQYQALRDQIEIEYNFLKKKQDSQDEDVLWKQATVDWYDHVYLPVVEIIRELGVLHRFPKRTEADMYFVLSERHDDLEKALGWHVEMETAVSDLITQSPEPEPSSKLSRLVKSVVPALDSGPPVGLWREQQLARNQYHHLFAHLLVGIDGSEAGWQMFEKALCNSKIDKDHILGLHVIQDESQRDSEAVRQIRARFEKKCREEGLLGEFAVEVGDDPAEVILKRAAWADAVMINLTRPLDGKPIPRLKPGLKLLLQKCPRPLHVLPDGTDSDFSHMLLAYDGSPKADEALFVATYLTVRWKKMLTVVTVKTAQTGERELGKAKEYLKRHGLTDVKYVLKQGAIVNSILEVAESCGCNFMIMGGMSYQPLRHLIRGSTAANMLRRFHHPMLICQ